MVKRGVFSLLSVLALAACQHAQSASPAVLQDTEVSTLDALRSALGEAIGQTAVELGAGDPTVTPSVAILPPKPSTFETQSPAMPTMFDLYVRGDNCFAIRRGDDAEIALIGVRCRPAN